jgi:hypothetical protein
MGMARSCFTKSTDQFISDKFSKKLPKAYIRILNSQVEANFWLGSPGTEVGTPP